MARVVVGFYSSRCGDAGNDMVNIMVKAGAKVRRFVLWYGNH